MGNAIAGSQRIHTLPLEVLLQGLNKRIENAKSYISDLYLAIEAVTEQLYSSYLRGRAGVIKFIDDADRYMAYEMYVNDLKGIFVSNDPFLEAYRSRKIVEFGIKEYRAQTGTQEEQPYDANGIKASGTSATNPVLPTSVPPHSEGRERILSNAFRKFVTNIHLWKHGQGYRIIGPALQQKGRVVGPVNGSHITIANGFIDWKVREVLIHAYIVNTEYPTKPKP